MRTYSIVLKPDDEEVGYTVLVPALPGCITEGDTVEECVDNAKDAIALYIRDAERHGETVPEEREHAQVLTVDVAA